MDHSPPTQRRKPPIATDPSDPTILIFFLMILFFFFLLFFFSFIRSHSPDIDIPNIIKPKPAKSKWFIIFLFIFAIIAGLLAQSNEHATNPPSENYPDRDRKVQVDGSSSYIDLRQKQPEISDSSIVNGYSPRKEENIYLSEPVSGDLRHRPRRRFESVQNVPESNVQRQSTNRVPPAPAPPPPQPAPSKHRREATEAEEEMEPTIGKRDQRNRQKLKDMQPPPSSSMLRNMFKKATPPPPPPTRKHRREAEEDDEEMAPRIASLRKRNRRDRQKPIDIQPSTSSMFRNIFNKEKKPKATEIVPATAPPPPPPRSGGKTNRFPSSSAAVQPKSEQLTAEMNQKSKGKSPIQPPSPPKSEQSTAAFNHESNPFPPKSESQSQSTNKPPLPKKASNYHDRDRFLSSDSELSSSSIPRPPPPPPFRLPARRFELRGHFVRLRSIHDSDFSSPDRDYLRSTTIDGGDSFTPSPISSPDVNAEADRYISKRKKEWRAEARKERK